MWGPAVKVGQWIVGVLLARTLRFDRVVEKVFYSSYTLDAEAIIGKERTRLVDSQLSAGRSSVRDGEDKRGVSLRALLCGGVFALFIGVSLPYSNMIIKGGLLAHNHNLPAALFVFFLFVGLVHTIAAAIRRSWAFTRGELATVYIMALIATAIPTIGFSEYLLPIIAGFT